MNDLVENYNQGVTDMISAFNHLEKFKEIVHLEEEEFTLNGIGSKWNFVFEDDLPNSEHDAKPTKIPVRITVKDKSQPNDLCQVSNNNTAKRQRVGPETHVMSPRRDRNQQEMYKHTETQTQEPTVSTSQNNASSSQQQHKMDDIRSKQRPAQVTKSDNKSSVDEPNINSDSSKTEAPPKRATSSTPSVDNVQNKNRAANRDSGTTIEHGVGRLTSSLDAKTPYHSKNPAKSVNHTSRNCMLVHDHFLNEFDSSKFTLALNIESHRVKSINEMLSKGGLISKIRKTKPEVTFIHAGLEDLYRNKATPHSLVDNYKKLVYDILESTQTKVCLSLIIPILGYPDLNKNISRVNEEVSEFVTFLRHSEEYRDRIYTSSNKRLGRFIAKITGAHGIDLIIEERGQRILWLTLKDSILRCLDQPQSDRRRSGGQRHHQRV